MGVPAEMDEAYGCGGAYGSSSIVCLGAHFWMGACCFLLFYVQTPYMATARAALDLIAHVHTHIHPRTCICLPRLASQEGWHALSVKLRTWRTFWAPTSTKSGPVVVPFKSAPKKSGTPGFLARAYFPRASRRMRRSTEAPASGRTAERSSVLTDRLMIYISLLWRLARCCGGLNLALNDRSAGRSIFTRGTAEATSAAKTKC